MTVKTRNEFNTEIVSKFHLKVEGVVLPENYDGITKCLERDYYFVIKDNKLGILDSQGKERVPIKYDIFTPVITDKYIYIRLKDKFGLLNHNGKIVVPFEWDEINYKGMVEDLIPVKKNNCWGILNIKTGELLIDLSYENIKIIEENCYCVCINGKWGIIGKYNIKPEYLFDFKFVGKYAIVFKGDVGFYDGLYDVWRLFKADAYIIDKKGNKKYFDILKYISDAQKLKGRENFFITTYQMKQLKKHDFTEWINK